MSLLDFLPKLNLSRVVISEDEIYTMVKGILNRPVLADASAETKAGVSIAITSIVENLKTKQVLTPATVDEVNQILSKWLNS